MDHADSENRERTLAEGVLYYVAVLLRYRWFILVTTLLAAAAVLTFSIISLRLPPEESPLPNRYRAYATLLLADEAGGGMAGLLEAMGLSASGRDVMAAAGRLVLEVLRSRSFTDLIIEKNDMVNYYDMHDANRTQRREYVSSNIDVRYDAAARLLTVGYEGIRPEHVQQVANSIVDELDNYFRQRGGLTRGRTLESLEETLAAVEREVALIEEQIRAFQQRYGVLTVTELAQSQSAMLRGLEAELVTLERTIRTYTERTRIENDPELIRLRSERAAVADLIREIEAGYAGGIRTMPARSQLPELALQLGRLETDLAIQQRIRTSLQEQYEVARLMAQSNTGFTILEMAEVPDEKIGPSRAQLSLTVTAGAFAAAVALSLVHYGWNSVRSNPKLMGIVAKNLKTKDPKKNQAGKDSHA